MFPVRIIARFAYRFVFADHGGLEAFVAKHAAMSPTVRFDVVPDADGEFNFIQMVFGPRPKKPRWKARDQDLQVEGDPGDED